MHVPEDRTFEFGDFTLVPRERQLLHDGKPVHLTAKAFDLLLALVRRAGHLVSKDELLREVWPDTFVEEVNLTVNISTLRRRASMDDKTRPSEIGSASASRCRPRRMLGCSPVGWRGPTQCKPLLFAAFVSAGNCYSIAGWDLFAHGCLRA